MELVEYFDTLHYLNDRYVDRKTLISVTEGKINLFGVRGSGKTALALDYLAQIEEESGLYIDIDDPNLVFAPMQLQALQEHIKENRIETLVLDHYTQGYFSSFPEVKTLIVITRPPLIEPGFEHMELFPLDYEEFLAFEGSASATNAFNHFLKSGTLPAMARSYRFGSGQMKLFWQSHFGPAEQMLLLILAQHHTRHVSVYQLYTFAKEKFKVSKDWLYKTIKQYTDEKLIHFIDDRYQKGGKKMILFDFAFAKFLTTGQPFIIQFDAMIALALIKHRIDFETLGIHGYITRDDTLIVPAPFEGEESFWVKSQNKFSFYRQHGVKKVTVITVANSYEFDIEKLHFEALPFYEWTVLYEED